jgi:hypothetical protein
LLWVRFCESMLFWNSTYAERWKLGLCGGILKRKALVQVPSHGHGWAKEQLCVM